MVLRGCGLAPDKPLPHAGWRSRNPVRSRRIAHVTAKGEAIPGFAGEGHTAVQVFSPEAFCRSDPFILLMDDTLDFHPGQVVGAAHPHAGLETVTLVLDGSIQDADEGLLQAGDLAWMTAGRGVVHNEHVRATGRARILQLWVALPDHERCGAICPPRLDPRCT